MAYYAALVSIVELLKEINHPEHPYSNYVLDKQQLHLSLYEKFNNLLQELLEDYSRKDLTEESADTLESRIRDVAYKAQDIIVYHISNQIPEVLEEEGEAAEEDTKVFAQDKRSRPKRNFRRLISAFKKAYRKLQPQRIERPMPDNIPEEEYFLDLRKVQEEVDSIVEELSKIKERHPIQEEDLQPPSNISIDNVGGSSTTVEAQSGRDTMVGFEEQLIAIKEKLCGQSVKLEVISIVGMGGLGKTTLARNIFDDKFIDDHFDCRAWVTISQDYHRPKVLQCIANSMNITEKEELAENIRKYLFGRKYLIVIDDIWDTKVWDDIKWIFPDTSNKSRIMLTTRLFDVAGYVGNSIFLHQMQFLNEDQSWTLLKQKVFAREHCPEELEAIGKLIAKNCRGLPLGIVVIAGVLSNVNKVQHDWKDIARHVSSVAIDQNDKHLLNILSLSYNHLPHHLKPCFLYLGGFPEDHGICISRLIRLWVAEGFLRPIESKSLEEIGEKYLKDLANRNLISFTKKDFRGKFKYCSLHDLVRDLCSQRAHYENFLHCLQKDDVYQESIGNVRRVFASEISLFLKYTTKHYSTIRTAISFSVDQNFLLATAKCKLLRILDASDDDMWYASPIMCINEILANEIFELLHLRYLTLDAMFDIHISPSICKIWNLQTLIVQGFSVSLPCGVWKMRQLRHLIMRGGFGVKIPPIPYSEISIIDGAPLLGRLQTLQDVNGWIFTCHTIEMIQSLKKLSVCYNIDPDEAYASWEEVGLNNLVHLHQLETLKIRFPSRAKPAIPLPENFAFPSSLTKLTLCDCRLPWKDMRAVGSLPNLLVLKLKWDAFVGEEWEPIEGQFLKLKLLLMVELHSLKNWRSENIHFPCLEKLYMECCYELEEIPLEIGDIPTLQFIEVIRCNSFLKSSALKIQEEQREQGNDDIQVRFV